MACCSLAFAKLQHASREIYREKTSLRERLLKCRIPLNKLDARQNLANNTHSNAEHLYSYYPLNLWQMH